MNSGELRGRRPAVDAMIAAALAHRAVVAVADAPDAAPGRADAENARAAVALAAHAAVALAFAGDAEPVGALAVNARGARGGGRTVDAVISVTHAQHAPTAEAVAISAVAG